MDTLENKIEIHEFFFQPKSSIYLHSSLWGDFNFSLSGILELNIDGRIFKTPPNYGLWSPPHTPHCCVSIDQKVIHFICIRVYPNLCDQISNKVQTLVTTPFFHALIKEALKQKKMCLTAYRHLLQVIFDQLCSAKSYDDYLPESNHPILSRILDVMGCEKTFYQATEILIQPFHISERHALRLCQQEFGISLNEWRNRAKILYAISALQSGKTIKQISYTLGYQYSSSFIEFFKRYTGKTPSQMR